MDQVKIVMSSSEVLYIPIKDVYQIDVNKNVKFYRGIGVCLFKEIQIYRNPQIPQ